MAQKKVNYPLVGVIMGSISDWETMMEACEVLDELNVSYEKRVVSAHRTPEWMSAYATQQKNKFFMQAQRYRMSSSLQTVGVFLELLLRAQTLRKPGSEPIR